MVAIGRMVKRERSVPVSALTVSKRAVATKSDKKAKVNLAKATESAEEYVSSDDKGETGVPSTPPPAKKHKAAAQRTKAATRQVKAPDQSKPRWVNTGRCFACGTDVHFARECPDKEAKARNDAYLASLPQRTQPKQMKPPGNEEQAP
ncbi:LOW QUALITY PROTEIN: hypothetical protein PHMEG_00031386 [Phytophthora megakarya]|uniref:CCHC-type domain-containing protein n=1 Tax=Phytophthora megakarya TaxID=4795 RepID=A0A225UZF0_9STRA|nr:LOW QUALITY PROTEIN: hypothetical protein PHMEG_00031386 [Phytophthora megakarya]